MPNPKTAPHPYLDVSNAGRGVWLVKVPKYIARRWEKTPGNINAGKLRIEKYKSQKPQITLDLSDAVLKLEADKIPISHILDVSSVTNQTLGTFVHVEGDTPDKGNAAPQSDNLSMGGRFVQKLECRPQADDCYMKMKLESIRKAAQPARQTKTLDKIVKNFKPVSDHKHNIEEKARRKAEGKHFREDKNKILDVLFNAFEKHQYYNIKDLVRITRQPITYLKEILNEVCDYNMKNPHKNMWELKREYRHYNDGEKKENINDCDDSDSSHSSFY
ncbi:general transcription factor IIF subunit 2-like [Toxorhynchites rutilus septentrionalis]|uniref:general transcription factor IIF subunit 2-like n=1 Tax=Toxorhynchites rutilus septentrionalis TaxID=329112 RepID=UPI00247A2FF2|nr:general transcription factor IIF subunit 2-like [Toxorhynchites rutilus septentrionalis]XP_055633155.1 general transcription factor IIF subunit 2-like [Toxorhynchites rutilus septentrionalis]